MFLTAEDARARVARGAALLDRVQPGWAHQINVGTLKLCESKNCILGQLSNGDWTDLSESVKDAIFSHGTGSDYVIEIGCMVFGSPGFYALLQDAWIEAIADRIVPAHAPEDARAFDAVAMPVAVAQVSEAR